MTIDTWLRTSTALLSKAEISTARLDALVLLADTLKKDKSWLLANPSYTLSKHDEKKLHTLISRRAKHEPLSYIRGKSEFYGREFMVNPHTLEPRPETETMVELALKILDKKYLIIDVGTGSGAIAITMKLELTDSRVFATDIDQKCIKTAKQNAKKLGADVKFYHGNLLEPLTDINYQTSDIVLLANLPYVPNKYELNAAATYEPKRAIFGGEDGLDLYRQLFSHLKNMYQKKRYSVEYNTGIGYVLTESLPFQHAELAKIAADAGYYLKQTDDFIQVFAPEQ